MKNPCLTSRLGSRSSPHRALLLISTLPLALLEPRTPSKLEGSSLLQTDCLRCSLHCLPGVLCFLPVSLPTEVSWRTSASFSQSLMSSKYLTGKAGLLLYLSFDILIYLLLSLFSHLFVSLSLSYLACLLPSDLVSSLIFYFYIFKLARWTKFLFAILIAFA